ncbi:MAG TPA: tetratricopeptide repeat protein [Spirochaetota bacterium]|mgnify:CR=1 FL=1|nr:tetratricopeptide repeat protein [Spirochaetota bacterium]
MNRKTLALSLLCTFLAAGLHGRPGGDTAPVIEMGVGGRALALGGAYTALADDATAIVFNPAGLYAVDGDELTLSWNAMGGFFWNMGFAGYAHRFGEILTMGIGTKFLLSGAQESWDSISEFNSFDENQYMLLLSASLDLPLALKLGASFKFAWRDFSWNSSSGDQARSKTFANADLGVILPVARELQFGLRIENVIPSVDFGLGDAKEPVETRIVTGAALCLLDEKLVVSTDFDWYPGLGEVDFRLGLGYRVIAGWTLYTGLDSGRFDFGIGVDVSDFSFHSSILLEAESEPSARFAVHYRVGKDKQEYRSIEQQLLALNKGIESFTKGDYAEARKQFRSVLQENPKNESARRLDQIAETRIRGEAWKTDDDRERIKSYVQKAENLAKNGSWAEARKAATAALDIDPLEWKARDLVEKIDRSVDELVENHWRDGVAAFVRNDLEESRKKIDALLSLRPEHREARDLLERIKRIQKDNWERKTNEERKLNAAELYRKRGMELFKRKIYVDAIDSFKVSLEYGENASTRYYLNLAMQRYQDLKISGQSMSRSGEFLAIARDQIKNKKIREAIASLEKALNYWPQNAEAERELETTRTALEAMVKGPYEEGLKAYKDGKYVEAIKKWREAIAIDPDHEPSKKALADSAREMRERSLYNLQLAETWVRRGSDKDLLEALKYFRIASELDPANEDAKKGFARTSARFEDLAKSLFDKGFDALKSGKLERLSEAIDSFERYLVIKPDDKQARDFLDESVKKRSQQQSWLTMRQRRSEGIDFYNNREYERAAVKFREALAMAPNDREISDYLKKCEERIKLSASRNRVLENFNTGIQAFKKREYDKAIETWKQIDGMPDATESDRQMVQGYIKTAEEVRVYNQNRYFILGEESAKAGRLLQAREALEEALKINKYHEKARTLLADVKDRITAYAFAQLRRGESLYETGNYTNAVTVLESAKLHNESDDRIQNKLDEAGDNLKLLQEAITLEQQGKPADAIVLYQKIVQNNPKDQNTRTRINGLSRRLSEETDQMIKKAEKQIAEKMYNDALLGLELVLQIVQYKQSSQARETTTRYARQLQGQARDLMAKALADAWAQGMRLYQAGNFEGSLPFFEQVWIYDRNYREIRTVRRVAMNKVAEARAAVAKRNEAQIQQLLYSGMSFYQQGNYQGAINAWSQILAISPGHSAAVSYIARARFKLGQ